MDHCTQCGYDYAAIDRAAIAAHIRALGPRYRTALTAIPDPRRQPAPDIWSPLQYTAHVRDVLTTQRLRITRARTEHHPAFAPMGREELALHYHAEDPSTVISQLIDAADALATTLETLDVDSWHREGLYNFPQSQLRTIDWIARHTIHEGEHHLLDVTRQTP